jgi:electron transfer flavoprotein alpha subunit
MTKEITEYQGVWVFAEQREGTLLEVGFECLNGGKQIAANLGVDLSAIVIGHKIEGLARELIAYGADNVYIIDHPLLEMYQSDAYAKVIANLIHEYKPEIFLLGASSNGMDLAPTVAAMVNTGLSAHITAVEVDEKLQLRQVVPSFGGKVMAVIVCPNHRPQMATIRPGVFSKPKMDDSRNGNLIKVDVNITESDLKAKTIQIVEEKPKEKPLEGAEIVVAVGWGMKAVKGFKSIRKLAALLGASIGGTRPAVDEGWIHEEQMIGQSGKTIRPKLYIGLGISGEMHHTVGILDSEVIVAVNNDENAPIFKMADIGIVGDIRDVLPHLLKELENYKT